MSEEHDERALDDMLAELRGTAADDQAAAAIEMLAKHVGHYYVALLRNGVNTEAATLMALDYQRWLLGVTRRP